MACECLQEREQDEAQQPLAIQRMQFGCEQFLIPAGVQRELVIGDDVGAPLRRRQVTENDRRNGVEPELAGRQQPAVPGNDSTVAINQDWSGPSELHDRGCDLRHLVVIVRAGIARIRDRPFEPSVLDHVRQSRRHVVRVGAGTAASGNLVGLPRAGRTRSAE